MSQFTPVFPQVIDDIVYDPAGGLFSPWGNLGLLGTKVLPTQPSHTTDENQAGQPMHKA